MLHNIASVRATALVTTLLFASTLVEGHGFLTKPASRNFLNYASGKIRTLNDVDTLETEYCPHCLSGGGVAGVGSNLVNGEWPYPETTTSSVRRGMCGDPIGSTDPKYNPYNQARAIANMGLLEEELGPDFSSTYTIGQTIELTVDVTAHHVGHMEFFLCDTKDLNDPDNLTQDCVNKHQLVRDPNFESLTPIDPKYPGRFFLEPKCLHDQDAPKEDGLQIGQRMTVHYKLPEGLVCDHCILQLWWITSNSCLPPGYREFFSDKTNNVMPECNGDGGSKGLWNEYLSDCGVKSIPEEFWNCADIRIIKNDNTVPSTNTKPTTTTTTAAATVTTTSSSTTTAIPTASTSSQAQIETTAIFNDDLSTGKCCWWPLNKEVSYDECVSYSPNGDWCAKSGDRCEGCGGNWIENNENDNEKSKTTTKTIVTTTVQTTTSQVSNTQTPTSTSAPIEDDLSTGKCCWWPMTGNVSYDQCVSFSPNGDWCAKSKERCGRCQGNWVENK